jgi:hypothetical protein
MALVHSRFSIYRLFSAHQIAALVSVGLTEAAKRRSKRRELIATNDLHESEHRLSRSRQRASQHLPGSVFDGRYKGLTADAARLDAAICRQDRLR